MTIVILLLGILWRLIRYALCMPVWGDEAAVALNLMDRNFGTILQPLNYGQVAPVLFLWIEMAIQKWIGASEYALRLFPLLAGSVAAILFWRWSKLLVNETVVLFAIGFYALGYYTVRHSVEIKPYAVDQLAATGLLLVGTLWMLQPHRLRYGWLLAATLPFAVAGSYPAVFLGGGLMLALAVALLRHRRIAAWGVWLLCGVALTATFVFIYTHVDVSQYNKVGKMMRAYWRDSFPPLGFLPWVRWMFDIHTGNMFAYPIGGNHGGSIVTFLLFLAGACWLIRNRGWDWRLLIFAPFVLTFIAAALHRYPYGGSARVAQHLAPAICLLAGLGLNFVLTKSIRNEHLRSRAIGTTFAVFVLIACFGIGRDFVKPYHGRGDQEVRSIIRQTVGQASSSCAIVVLQPMRAVPSNQQYYLRLADGRVQWSNIQDLPTVANGKQRLVLMNFDASLDLTESAGTENLRNFLANWEMTQQRKFSIRIGPLEPPYWQLVTLQLKQAL